MIGIMTSPLARIFATFLVLATLAPALALGAPDKPTVTGTFLGDGKDGNLKFLVVENREPFSDKAAIRLVFTEKDPSKSKKPGFDAGFKKLGSALVVSVHRDGSVFGCEVAHSAHEKSPFSAVGVAKMSKFEVTDTMVSGHLTTGGDDDFFDQTWNVDLEFSAPLPPGAFADVEEEPAPEAAATPEPEAAGPKPSAKEIPIPASAKDVQIKPTVGQVSFISSQSVAVITKEISDILKAKGWKDGKGGLATKTNAILMRERDGGTLTIMIKAAGAGSSVNFMTQGLDWTESPEAPAGSTAEAAPAPGVKDIEADANKLLQDALKMIPGGR